MHRRRRREIHVALGELCKFGCTCENLEENPYCRCEDLPIHTYLDFESPYLGFNGDIKLIRWSREKLRAAYRCLEAHETRGNREFIVNEFRNVPGIPGAHLRGHFELRQCRDSYKSCTISRLEREFRARGCEPLLTGPAMLRALAELSCDHGTCSVLTNWSYQAASESFYIDGCLSDMALPMPNDLRVVMPIDGNWEVREGSEPVQFVWVVLSEVGWGWAISHRPSSGGLTARDTTFTRNSWSFLDEQGVHEVRVSARRNRSPFTPEPITIHIDGPGCVLGVTANGCWGRPLHSREDADSWARDIDRFCNTFGFAKFFDSSFGRQLILDLLEAVAPRRSPAR